MKYIVLTIVLFFACQLGISQTLKIVTKAGKEYMVDYSSRTISKKGISLDKHRMIKYSSISYIGTDDIEAFEKVMRRAGTKRNKHLNIDFTGDEDVYAIRLQKLRENRAKANIAGGAGGLLMLIGAISGDRDVYTVGAATLGAGIVAESINEQRTLETQNQAIMANQQKMMAKQQAETEEQAFRREFGNENVDGLISLIDGNHERAIAFANVAETSKDANHRVAASWLKAITYADNGQQDELNGEYQKLVILDSEIDSVESAEKWMILLLQDLEELRKG